MEIKETNAVQKKVCQTKWSSTPIYIIVYISYT